MNALTTAHLFYCQLQAILAAMPKEHRHAPSASKQHTKAYRRHHASATLAKASRAAPAPPELGSMSTSAPAVAVTLALQAPAPPAVAWPKAGLRATA